MHYVFGGELHGEIVYHSSHVVFHVDLHFSRFSEVKGHSQVVVYFSSLAGHCSKVPVLGIQPVSELIIHLGVYMRTHQVIHMEPNRVLPAVDRSISNAGVVGIENKFLILEVLGT